MLAFFGTVSTDFNYQQVRPHPPLPSFPFPPPTHATSIYWRMTVCSYWCMYWRMTVCSYWCRTVCSYCTTKLRACSGYYCPRTCMIDVVVHTTKACPSWNSSRSQLSRVCTFAAMLLPCLLQAFFGASGETLCIAPQKDRLATTV